MLSEFVKASSEMIIKEAPKEIYTTLESPLALSLDAIENLPLSVLKAQNELYLDESKPSQIQINKEAGSAREDQAEEELKEMYPEDEGYKIIAEAYLRDEQGNIVKDPVTGEGRRIDFVVVKDGDVVASYEITSETAPKDAQTAKEERIRECGGNYVKDRDTGQLVKIPDTVTTTVRRYA